MENRTGDEELLKRYADGDFAAFECLYKKHKGGVYRYILRQVKHPNQCEDIFQDVWSSVVQGAVRFIEDSCIDRKDNQQRSTSFKAWLYTIARNKVIDRSRHLKMVQKVIVEHRSDVTSGDERHSQDSDHSNTETLQDCDNTLDNPETTIQTNKQSQSIDYCLARLPKHQLDCFLMREEGALTANAIAQIVGISMEASKSRLKSAYKNLRLCLQKQLDGDLPFSTSKSLAGRQHE